MKYLSGATGYTILRRDSKDILLLADIHDGVNYCESGSGIFIDEYLMKHSKNSQILLEESINDPELNLTDLWPDAEHTRKLKLLKEKDDSIIPTDIRPYLIPFSWQLAESNKKYQDITVKKYMSLFILFFNKKGIVYERFIFPYIGCNNGYIVNENDREILRQMFDEFNKIFMELCELAGDKTIQEMLKLQSEKGKYNDYLHNIDNINSLIMEYYILLLTLSDKRNSIIHTGLAHSTRLIEMFENLGFKIIENVSMTHISSYSGSDKTNACIANPGESKFMDRFIDRINKKSMFI